MTHRIQFGPTIPLVPVGDFVKHHDAHEFYDTAWHLVGPTIERNFEKLHAQPHLLYCVAFIEGMRMASHVLREGSQNEPRKQELRTPKESPTQEPARGLYELGEW